MRESVFFLLKLNIPDPSMKNTMKRCFLLLMFLGLSQCQSAGAYYHNRVFDFTDIFHLGIEKDVYGVSGFVGPVGIGLQKADKGIGAGGRFGYIGVYNTGMKESVTLL